MTDTSFNIWSAQVAGSVLKIPVITKVQTSDAGIRKAVTSSMARMLNRRWTYNQGLHTAIKNDVSTLISEALKSTDTYRSLVSSDGTLRKEFGLQYKESQVDPIIEAAANSVLITFSPFRSTAGGAVMSGNITLNVFEINFENELAQAPTATFVSEHDKVVPWVKWLLTQGDRIAVRGYVTKVYPQRSRTRSLIMVEPRQSGGEKNYRVPPEYSGSIGDNFITKTLDDNVAVMAKLLRSRLQRAL
jgi:hypothetical protein